MQVKFSAGKSEAIAEGVFVSATRIKVCTPSFEAFGPQQVDVTVQISGEGWTVQKQTFTYFANTMGRNSLAFGPGLLPAGVAGVEMPFLIQARNTLCEKCESGGDHFDVVVSMVDRPDVVGRVRTSDVGNGSYSVHYSVPMPGKYEVIITHMDLGTATPSPLRGSPFTVVCKDAWHRPRVLGQLPAKRKAASLVPMGKDLVLFGGEKGGAPLPLRLHFSVREELM